MQGDLTQGAVAKKLVLFAFPILLGILFQQLYTTVDAIIIGNFAGKNAIAAIDGVAPIIRLPINFFTGLSTGATIIISKYFGQKDYDSVKDVSHTAIAFACIGGLILSVVFALLAPFLVELVQVPAEIKADATAYLQIYFGGLVFSMVYNIGAGIFRAVGNSKTPLYFLIIVNILNVIFDILLVVVIPLGVVGAVIATVMSQLISCVLVVWGLTKTDLPCRIYIKQVKINITHLKQIAKLGVPMGVQSTIYPIANTIIQTSINGFGVNYIAGWAVCGKIDLLIWNIPDAFSNALATFTAQNHGAKLYDRAKEGVRVSMGITLALVGTVAATLYFFNQPLGKLFVDDSDVLLVLSDILNLIGPFYIVYAIGDVLSGAIRGSGETLKPMLITLVCTCVFRIFWIFCILPFNYTFMMLFACYPISWVITAIVFIVFYNIHSKKIIVN